MTSQRRYSCITCARRKVKCDKLSPCSSCSKSQVACIYRDPVPSQRHRKRVTQRDLLAKIQELETILHSNRIPFEALDNSWISSHWEERVAQSPQIHADSVETATTTEVSPQAQFRVNLSQSTHNLLGEQTVAARLWSELPEVLKTPPILRLKQADEEAGNNPTHDDNDLQEPSLFIPTHISITVGQLELHPDPKHAFKLWQIFADNVNPLIKIIHAPTLQEKILEAAWTPESTAKPLEATMFAVYALAVASMKPASCIHLFGEGKQLLVNRYRVGALRALSITDLLSTRDMEVLQALTLVLMIDPQSELSITAVALAMRIAHKLGLHHAGKDAHMPFFEQEMQVRLWWCIRGFNSRARRGMGLLSTIDDLGDVRLPMNVNDADLHPLMEKPPAVQHTAATEMVYCLMKYDLWNYVRKSSRFSGDPNPREKAAQLATSTSVESMAVKREMLGHVTYMLQERYLAYLDQSIPLHQLSIALAGLTVHNQRFSMFHPRHQPERGRNMSQADQDLIFESSIKLLELNRDLRQTNFSINLVDHMACKTPVDALVYMASELRQRISGHLVDTAWILLEELFNEQSMTLPGEHKFYAALADLILQAWAARRRTLEDARDIVPTFIKKLQETSEAVDDMPGPASAMENLQAGFMGDLMDDESLSWTYWNDLLQL
ncbi:hypothetical protein M441DRAFT_330267 [Trichoderma asperellum CBS 433.97]|uniref:Zn(2)-C6 fungal-type domain-containing protein n=1 Tax=Trichoderma asperellum (strain ATCC 204424 / CBS 433.97 / NBRC 101777) TaxID=1042311 RepID=A0A2T3YS83_TRIA4|nr:hypothetical protein M441DRAFT_330267 [Trichoderma asperellum CBS 433.97]PTB35366.1 hypothetical protein M441DRAFT_330267 [Trichoderma asperellum CBS 433.97]